MKYRSVGVALLLAILASTGGCTRAEEKPPSIILVMIDTLRADYLGAYGFDGRISPNLDALAGESILFEQCYSQAPWTKPAIATLFTGLDPVVHKVLTHAGRYGEPNAQGQRQIDTDALAPGARTLAELLQGSGYETVAFVGNPWIQKNHGFGQGFDVYDERFRGNTVTADALVGPATQWVRNRAGDKPYFLYLHLMDVHDPYDAPESDVAAVRGSPSLETDRRLTLEQLPQGQLRKMRAMKLPWAESDAVFELREWRTRYAAGVHAVDRRLARFLGDLRAMGELDEAVLVITADHGEELFEHKDWAHGKNIFDHQLHIPLMVRMPGGDRGGRRVSQMVALADIMPTLAAIGGAEALGGLQGRDLSPLLAGEAFDDDRPALFATGVKWQPHTFAARTDAKKLIRNGESGRRQLFDVGEDPGERHDTSASAPKVLTDMERQLDAYLEEAARHPGIGEATAEIDPEVQERLRQLGYLE